MFKKESIQHKLDHVCLPRVHITYDVEIGDAIEVKELPFVIGVLGDFSGAPEQPLPRLRDRKFIEIDRDNFNQVMAGMRPRLALKVDDKLANDGTKLEVELRFNSLEDFEPDGIVQQVEPLRKLVETRRRLLDLLSKIDGNARLEELLQEIIHDPDSLQQLGAELGLKDCSAEEERKEVPDGY
jgi:type VI secretion system protein ImpB